MEQTVLYDLKRERASADRQGVDAANEYVPECLEVIVVRKCTTFIENPPTAEGSEQMFKLLSAVPVDGYTLFNQGV